MRRPVDIWPAPRSEDQCQSLCMADDETAPSASLVPPLNLRAVASSRLRAREGDLGRVAPPISMGWFTTPTAQEIVIRRPSCTSRDAGTVFGFGQGEEILNPGPHRPEPCRWRVLRCPTDSRVVLANTKSTRLVSFGDPLEPSGAGNA